MAFSSTFSSLGRSVRPGALAFFGLFTSSSSAISRSSSTSARCAKFLVRPASEFATRECPTPLILLRATGIGKEDTEDWSSWAGMFAERGYTAVEVDIEAPARAADSAKSLLDGMASELAHQIRLLSIPFAPIVIASRSSTLLSQTFISNHPASGLVLISPPTQLAIPSSSISVSENGELPTSDMTALPDFTYEPQFPILLVSPRGSTEQIKEEHRLMQSFTGKVGRGGQGVSFEEVDDEKSDATRIIVERWMDRCGW